MPTNNLTINLPSKPLASGLAKDLEEIMTPEEKVENIRRILTEYLEGHIGKEEAFNKITLIIFPNNN